MSRIAPVAAVLILAGVAGCSATESAGGGIAFAVLPAYPRDETLPDAVVERFAGDSLEGRVVEWHTAADWVELEAAIRAAAERRHAVLTSVWKGQVLRVTGQSRTHQCHYLVVLLGSTTRLLEANPQRSISTVCSLEHGSLREFLECVLEGMDVFQERARRRPQMLAAPADAPDGNKPAAAGV
jgi:hypothetical protein